MREAAFNYNLEADRADPVREQFLHERPASAADDQGNKDQEDKIKIEAREASMFWRGVLADPVGRREMFKALNLAEAFATPFAAVGMGFPDERATWYKAGQVSIGQRFYQMLAITARDELFKLQDEMNLFGDLAVRPDRKI